MVNVSYREFQISFHGKLDVQNGHCLPISNEYVSVVFQSLSINQSGSGRGMYTNSDVHELHADANFHLLLVWQRGQIKGALV